MGSRPASCPCLLFSQPGGPSLRRPESGPSGLFVCSPRDKNRPPLCTEAACFNRSSRRCGAAPPDHSRGCRRDQVVFMAGAAGRLRPPGRLHRPLSVRQPGSGHDDGAQGHPRHYAFPLPGGGRPDGRLPGQGPGGRNGAHPRECAAGETRWITFLSPSQRTPKPKSIPRRTVGPSPGKGLFVLFAAGFLRCRWRRFML